MSFVKRQNYPCCPIDSAFEHTIIVRVGQTRPPAKIDLLKMRPGDDIVHDRVNLMKGETSLLQEFCSFQDTFIFKNQGNADDRSKHSFIDQGNDLTRCPSSRVNTRIKDIGVQDDTHFIMVSHKTS